MAVFRAVLLQYEKRAKAEMCGAGTLGSEAKRGNHGVETHRLSSTHHRMHGPPWLSALFEHVKAQAWALPSCPFFRDTRPNLKSKKAEPI